jgi:hypothetical protein
VVENKITVLFDTNLRIRDGEQMVNEKPTNALIIHCIGTQYSPTCFGTLKCHHQGVKYDPAEMVPIVVGSREGWELYIVTDGVMVGIILFG